jgi:hemerythrin
MPQFAWDESLLVGYEQIDEQHKHLAELANQLHDAMSGAVGRQAVGPLIIINDIIEHTRAHFATEEGLMQAHSYPLAASHASLHADAMRKVVDLRSQYVAGQPELTIPLLQYIQAWEISDIRRSDKALGLFLAATVPACERAVLV